MPEETSDLVTVEPSQRVSVYFNPPLWLQRRTWVLNQLRSIHATTVIDLGCGEGSLLRVLTEPASCLPSRTSSDAEPEKTLDIHITHAVGIDIHEPSLRQAVIHTSPDLPEGHIQSAWLKPALRWTNLQLDIWRGGLEILNGKPAARGRWEYFGRTEWDAIASTEVVEHLPADILAKFMPVVLGVYQPKHLFLTTPNYNFNQLFSAPGAPNANTGYPDPTGATDRVFRHDDHKREWTEEEWQAWCQESAQTWGYDVTLGSIGVAEERDPWGREAQAGKASLTAAFHKRTSRDQPRDLLERRAAALRMAKEWSRKASSKHTLLVRYRYDAHPNAGKPRPRDDVVSVLRTALQGELEYYEGKLLLDDLWRCHDVAIACGGLADVLVDTLESLEQPEWTLNKDIGDAFCWKEQKWSWTLTWHHFVKMERGISPGPSVGSDGWGDNRRYWNSNSYCYDDDDDEHSEEQEPTPEVGSTDNTPVEQVSAEYATLDKRWEKGDWSRDVSQGWGWDEVEASW